ncbi:MAG: 4-hydroxybenzoyl-CoA reductase subunit beta [Parvularculaceae bacterium]
MEFMPEFSVARPNSLIDLMAARQAHPDACLLAGGTDLIANIRRGIVAPEHLIELTNVAELQGVAATDSGGLRIGAGVTLAALIEDARVQSDYPVVADAAREVAAATHREVATVGGNLCLDTRCVYYNQSEWWRGANDYCLKSRGEICHVAPKGDHCFAAFSGDLAPALIVLDATVEIAAPAGMRRCPLQDIYADDGRAHLRLSAEDCLVAVELPAPNAGLRAGYAKARVRGAIDFPLAGVAVALSRASEIVTDLRVALTGVSSCPLLVAGARDIIGAPLNEDALDRLVNLLPKQIQPMTSTFTPPGYRRKVIANLTRSLARRLFEEAA